MIRVAAHIHGAVACCCLHDVRIRSVLTQTTHTTGKVLAHSCSCVVRRSETLHATGEILTQAIYATGEVLSHAVDLRIHGFDAGGSTHSIHRAQTYCVGIRCTQARDLFCEARCTLFEEIDDDRVEERSHHTTCDELPSLRILDSLAHQVDARSCSNAATDDSCVRLHRCRQETKTLGGCSSICLCIYFWECFRSHLLGNQKILQEAGEELVRDHTRGDEATGLNPLHDHTRRISTKAARNSIPSATTSTNRCSTRGCPTNRPTTIAHYPTTIPTNRPTTIAHYPTTIPTNRPTTIAHYPTTTHGALSSTIANYPAT